MGKPTGFKEYTRELPDKRPPERRVGDFREIHLPFPREKLTEQTARCMDCGVPTCHAGCPLGNLIPDWNDAVYRDRFQEAAELLQRTNNFPEFTGRLCPAPCEEACVLGINQPPVTIEQIEKEIVETAFAKGWIHPRPPDRRTGKTVAVIGSGPSGLACADQLNRAGHRVTVFERDNRIGGLLRYGIPDFKLEKRVLDRRLALMAEEGVAFKPSTPVDADGPDLAPFDAVVLCMGATVPRDLPVPGRSLAGIHFAMPFLTGQNRALAMDPAGGPPPVSAAGKHVVVIGGGDTGSDCIGTCNRQGALSVVNFELLPQPGPERPDGQPWPFWPNRLRTSSSHEEGCERHWQILTKAFEGDGGQVTGLTTVSVDFTPPADGPPQMHEIPGTEKRWPADLVLLALGFTGPQPGGVLDRLGIGLDERGNIRTDGAYRSDTEGVFAAGDARRGQSLIVWAISEGRECARQVDIFLTGRSDLPAKGEGDLPRVG
jgi:glutamate synthase (NADPH/NADH) small chain